MRKVFLPLLFAVSIFFCGCSVIQRDIAADAVSAAAVATAVGRPQDIPCFTAIGAIDAAAKGTSQPAILTDTEIGLGIQMLAQGPCAPIIGAVALAALRKTPFVGIGIP